MSEKVLEQRVLDKLAKEFKIEQKPEKQVWAEVPKNYCFGKAKIERAVEIALEEALK